MYEEKDYSDHSFNGKPKPPKKGIIQRAKEALTGAKGNEPPVISKAQGKSTGSNFKQAAATRGAAMRELMGADNSTPPETKVVKKK